MTEAAQAQEPKQAQTVITGEGLREFQLEKLGIKEESPVEQKEVIAEAKQEEQAHQEEEIPEDGTVDGSRVVFRGKWVDKKDYNYRMHLKTEAEKKAIARAEAAEAKLRELESKKPDAEKTDDDGKPDPAKFTDAFEYAEKLAEWKVKQELKAIKKQEAEEKKKEEEAKVIEGWNKRLSKAQREIEDFDDVLANSPVKNNDFSAQVQAAMVESDIGPQLLYHFAKNPDLVEKLKGMTVTAALREVGKIEAKLEAKEEKPKDKPQVTKSAAPAPIKPVVPTSGSASSDGYFDENGEFTGSIADFKRLRKEGKIK